MDQTKIKMSLIKYQMRMFQLLIGTKKVDIAPEEIMYFNIVEDFEKYYFPYFEVEINVSNAVYRLMMKNPTKIKVNLSLYKGKKRDVYHSSDDSSTSFKRALNGTFRVFLDGTSPDLSEDIEKKIDKDGTKYGQLTTVKFALYSNTYYNKYDLVVNGNFLNVSLADMVGYILTKTKMSKVLMSPPSNYKKYKQFILPPLPTHEQLTRICDTYALHSKGSIVYFGLDRAYIIDKVPKCTAYAKNEYKISYILYSSNDKSTPLSGGCGTITKDKVNILNAVSFESDNKREITKKTVGKNIVSVDANGKVTKSNKKSSKVTKVVVQNQGNSTVKSIKRDIAETKKMIHVEFMDIDIGMLTPNKQFILSIDGVSYKKYNGKYRLVKATHTFKKEGNFFQVVSSCDFKG